MNKNARPASIVVLIKPPDKENVTQSLSTNVDLAKDTSRLIIHQKH